MEIFVKIIKRKKEIKKIIGKIKKEKWKDEYRIENIGIRLAGIKGSKLNLGWSKGTKYPGKVGGWKEGVGGEEVIWV